MATTRSAVIFDKETDPAMPHSSPRRAGAFLLLVVFLLMLPACSKKDELVFGQKVHGKVTFNNQPVPYGFVLFYAHDKSVIPKTGIVPVAHAKIGRDGTYDIPNVPAGPMKVCVFTDPDVEPAQVLAPAGSSARPPGPAPGGSTGKTGELAGKRFNPVTQRLTEEQKGTLRTIHTKYGEFLSSPLMYVVKEGDQTWDIDLK
jgi:hypothetical protein